ncbi:uncharacterized protein N7459_007740 [Penicillium hispanicum]|uniref:uncharacterized protein n=1 Tax=Penicillium hispanicum TaxID=1080232 RepID=UPI0025401CDF|nr:uncharacterized protein N7459_007740 [Penicillium hispanicum]KAJ5578776.1 hypothetical protein N7459_007740 [Penicillium hispanicum]
MRQPKRIAGAKTTPESSKMASTSNLAKSHKRKRDLDVPRATTPTPTKKHKRRESLPGEAAGDDGSTKKRKKRKDVLQGEHSPEPTGKESAISPKRSQKTAANSHDLGTQAGKKSKDSRQKRSGQDNKKTHESADINMESTDKQDVEGPIKDQDQHKSPKSKHAGILSKFERTKTVASAKAKKSKPSSEELKKDTIEPVIAQGLEPLPQPENPPELETAPTYSSLPPWLANPLRAPTTDKTKFSDLGIKHDLLRILEQNNYKEAFAVQSTVIPLLLEGENHHPGDLCISAATGSGKTLSYVLPLVTALDPRPASRLRGLIVVPTRELVKQAREACELCASGSRLHIGSAVGNVAIKEEQKLLMRIDQVYNPATVAHRQQTGLQGNDWMDFNLEDCVSEAVDSNGFLPGYIQKPEPNVDILICTPGRLVDHLRYTKGFTLKHLEWLVIDEADRLLNESFQEWVDVVIGSLDARQAPETFGPGGKLLSELGLTIETKPPRKVVLSATMTRDISQLNSLRLVQPKMVIIGAENAMDPEDPSATQSETHFTLPPRLHEYTVPVGDGSRKPLYLLHLLLSYIEVDVDARAISAAAPGLDSDSSSSGESSDDESSDDETSSSGSDSDSDSDSDSESESESESESDDNSTSDSSSDGSSPETPGPESIKRAPESVRPNTTVLIFTKSSESASRLSRLMSILHPSLADRMGTIIKSNNSSASRRTLTAFRQGRISVIVATDRASRGLDLPSLNHVVNYDVPTSVTTYVHRVGRTARAGREGSAWTLVAHREGRWFANEIAASVDGRITRASTIDRVGIKADKLKTLESKYATALDALEQEVKVGKAPMSRF